MELHGLDDGVPTGFECADALPELLVLTLQGTLDGTELFGILDVRDAYAGPEGLVLSLELGSPLLEGAELGLATVAAVLGSDAIAVSTSLLAFFWSEVGTTALARSFVVVMLIIIIIVRARTRLLGGEGRDVGR